MMIKITELIMLQAKTFIVMFCAGILIESFWQAKKILQSFCSFRVLWFAEEVIFWAASAAALPAFLYYCAFGRISFHALVGFLTGLLLWKKICCGIIRTWVKDDEAKNLKTAARLSIWKKPEKSGWKKEKRKKKKKKRKLEIPQSKIREGRWLSEKTAKDGE